MAWFACEAGIRLAAISPSVNEAIIARISGRRIHFVLPEGRPNSPSAIGSSANYLVQREHPPHYGHTLRRDLFGGVLVALISDLDCRTKAVAFHLHGILIACGGADGIV